MLAERFGMWVVISCVAALATPTAAHANADVPALIRQLGDADFRVREAATDKLRAIGRAALPALREATSGDDPEVCSRADALVRQIERPRVPAGWFHQFSNWQRRETGRNGPRVTEARQAGRTVRITEGPGGIDMTLTGEHDGEVITAAFRARDVADLARQDPEAAAIYERVSSPRNSVLRGRRLVPAQPLGRARLLPLAPDPLLLRPPADDLAELDVRLRQQMEGAGVPEPDREAVLEAMALLRRIQEQGRLGAPEDIEQQIRKYNALSDALRQKLDDLKLPGPGDALPPPARARLGVSVAPPAPADVDAPPAAAGVRVTMVIPQSRGEKLGLKEGDLIRKVNGKAVEDAAALRRVLTDETDPLVLDVLRGDESLTLREEVD